MRGTVIRMAHLVRSWPWGIACAAIAYSIWSFDWTAVLPAIARVPGWRFILIETVLISGVLVACAFRWIAVTGLPVRGSLFVQVFVYTSVAVAIGQNTPMQVGEALKIKFARKSGLPIGRSTISLITERLVDLATMLDLALVGFLRRYGAPDLLVWLAILVPVAAVFCLPTLFRAVRRHTWLAGRVAWLKGSDDGLRLPRLATLIILTGIKWIISALAWQFALQCVGCRLGLADCMLTLATVSVISLVSMVPGGFGIQELSVKAMLVSLGIAPETAEAGSIAIRLLTPLMMLIGLIQVPSLLWRQSPLTLEHG